MPIRAAGCLLFQFTPLREGRRYMVKKGEHAALFQFTPLREGRLVPSSGMATCGAIFQFTPLREGRLPYSPQAVHRFISIHAPPRGATSALRSSAQSSYFNSRPSARGDGGDISRNPCPKGFQFTPLREGRPYRPACFCRKHAISIHAPPRGATVIWRKL